jgi:hypothetical protein
MHIFGLVECRSPGVGPLIREGSGKVDRFGMVIKTKPEEREAIRRMCLESGIESRGGFVADEPGGMESALINQPFGLAQTGEHFLKSAGHHNLDRIPE